MDIRFLNGNYAPTTHDVIEVENETYNMVFRYLDEIEDLGGMDAGRIAQLCADVVEAELRKLADRIGA